MVKFDRYPSRSASRRRIRPQAAWKVRIQIARARGPTTSSIRERISAAALFVNVIATISFGEVRAVRGIDLDVAPGEVRAVRGIDLDVAPGETLALLGPNGAGKSTTIDMLLGLLPPDEGTIAVFGSSPRAAVDRGAVG